MENLALFGVGNLSEAFAGLKLKPKTVRVQDENKGMSEVLATAASLKVKVERLKCDWKNLDLPGASIKEGKYGKYNAMAGSARDQEILDSADTVLLLGDDPSLVWAEKKISWMKKQGQDLTVLYWPPKSTEVYQPTGDDDVPF